jgi:hypothetical protein
MKPISKLTIFVLPFLALAASAYGQSPLVKSEKENESKQAAITAQAKTAAGNERSRPNVEGKWTMNGIIDFQIVRDAERFTITGEEKAGKYGWRATNVLVDQKRVRFAMEQPDCPQCRNSCDLLLSLSGNELTGTMRNPDGSTNTISFTRLR